MGNEAPRGPRRDRGDPPSKADLELATDLVQGLPPKIIAKKHHITPQSIYRIRAGRVRPQVRRIVREFNARYEEDRGPRAIEIKAAAMEKLHELLEATKRVWDKQAKKWIEVPDTEMQLRAADLLRDDVSDDLMRAIRDVEQQLAARGGLIDGQPTGRRGERILDV